MTHMIIERIRSLKNKDNIQHSDLDCDILVIGHGSSDKNARDASDYVGNSVKPFYRPVGFCFPELDRPDICQRISGMLMNEPKVLILMPYFLHKGVHVKRDVANEVSQAFKKHSYANTHMIDHLGVDQKLIDLVIERAECAEKNRNGFI